MADCATPCGLPRGEGVNVFRASSAQERLWALEQLAPGTAVANVAGAVRATGRLLPAGEPVVFAAPGRTRMGAPGRRNVGDPSTACNSPVGRAPTRTRPHAKHNPPSCGVGGTEPY